MNKKPIMSVLDYNPSTKGLGPNAYLFNVTGPVGVKIQPELDFRLQDFCRIQQIVYGEVNARDQAIGEIDPSIYLPSSDVDSLDAIMRSRRADHIIALDKQNQRMIAFVDHMTIVGLWAIAEQYLGKIYRQTKALKEGGIPETIPSPYKWNDFGAKFSTLGINLTTCENYTDANECRAVNNAIKHNPIVDSNLDKFGFFCGHSGKELELIDLHMQRYLNGVSNFLGSLISKANALFP